MNVAGLAWELDFWGQFRRAVESADAHLCSTIYNYDDVLVLLISDVASNYVTLRTAEQRIQYARKNVEIQKGSLNLADVKFRNGATTRLDVTQGQSNLSQTEATIPPLEAQRRQAANQLCILLGMPPRDIEKALGKRDIPSASPLVAVGVPADLLRRRPDIRRAEARRGRPVRPDRRGHRRALSAFLHLRQHLLRRRQFQGPLRRQLAGRHRSARRSAGTSSTTAGS